MPLPLLLNALKDHPELHFISDPERLSAVSTDQRGRFHGQPLILVEPSNTAAVQTLMAHCYAHRIPVVPQGGNTSMCGGATPDHSGNQIVLSLRRLRAIREVDALNATLTVEAGLTLQEVQEAAKRAGYLFPLSLAAQGTCQIGGNLSTNAGGIHVLRYGMMRDFVLGLEVVLPDGRLWQGLRGLRKDNTGYSLKHLFVGAEGTLGIITAATLKMVPQWAHVLGLWIGAESLEDVDQLLSVFRRIAGDRLTAFEVMSAQTLRWVQMRQPDWILPAPLTTPWIIWVELAESAPKADLLAWLESHLSELDKWQNHLVVTQTTREHAAAWQWREMISDAKKTAVRALNYDISLPISALRLWIYSITDLLREHFPILNCTCYGHWGDGNLHWSIYVSHESPPETLSTIEGHVTTLIYDSVYAHGGSISAEHGLGQLKATLINHYQDPVERALMREIKAALDPRRIMNPGKVVDSL